MAEANGTWILYFSFNGAGRREISGVVLPVPCSQSHGHIPSWTVKTMALDKIAAGNKARVACVHPIRMAPEVRAKEGYIVEYPEKVVSCLLTNWPSLNPVRRIS
jgi:hypothetical protein